MKDLDLPTTKEQRNNAIFFEVFFKPRLDALHAEIEKRKKDNNRERM